jgi:quercetin dioxygenase-like cupin family protein
MKKSHMSMQNLPSNRLLTQRLYSCQQQSRNKRRLQSDKESLTMNVRRCGSQPSGKGPAEYFTGNVRIDPLFEAPDPARARGASVTFEPGARSAWHTHPLGQTLIVTSGCGWVQSEGGPKVEMRPGDVIWCPPKEKHWHGATPTTALTHIAIQEALAGKVVEWLEKVSDEEYRK